MVLSWPDDAVGDLVSEPVDLGRLEVRETGAVTPPVAGQSVQAWLKMTCDAEEVPLILVQCPGEATHTQCQRLLKTLKRQADCPYQY